MDPVTWLIIIALIFIVPLFKKGKEELTETKECVEDVVVAEKKAVSESGNAVSHFFKALWYLFLLVALVLVIGMLAMASVVPS
jgi:hypothetical protein